MGGLHYKDRHPGTCDRKSPTTVTAHPPRKHNPSKSAVSAPAAPARRPDRLPHNGYSHHKCFLSVRPVLIPARTKPPRLPVPDTFVGRNRHTDDASFLHLYTEIKRDCIHLWRDRITHPRIRNRAITTQRPYRESAAERNDRLTGRHHI